MDITLFGGIFIFLVFVVVPVAVYIFLRRIAESYDRVKRIEADNASDVDVISFNFPSGT